MEFKITTIYKNCDQEWLDWYYKRMADEKVLPGGSIIVEELKECGHAVYSSKDTSSEVIGITTYQVTK